MRIMIGIVAVVLAIVTMTSLGNFVNASMSASDVLQKYQGANENETLQNIQAAVNNKSLACSDVPTTIIAFNCPDTQAKLDALKTHSPSDTPVLSDAQTNANSNNPAGLIVDIIAVILSGLMILRLIMKGHRYTKYGALLVLAGMIGMLAIWNTGMDDNGRVGASVIDCGIFLGIAIAFFVRGSQESRFANVRDNTRSSSKLDSWDDDWSDRDSSTLEDSITTYDVLSNHRDVYAPLYDEEKETLRSDGTPLHTRTNDQNSKIQKNSKQDSLKTHHKLLYSLGILKEKKK